MLINARVVHRMLIKVTALTHDSFIDPFITKQLYLCITDAATERKRFAGVVGCLRRNKLNLENIY